MLYRLLCSTLSLLLVFLSGYRYAFEGPKSLTCLVLSGALESFVGPQSMGLKSMGLNSVASPAWTQVCRSCLIMVLSICSMLLSYGLIIGVVHSRVDVGSLVLAGVVAALGSV